MTRTRHEVPATTGDIFTMSAGWTDFPDAQASGGHFEYAAAGATCSIVPASTTTAVLLGGFANANVATAQIKVDGVVEGTWMLWNETTNASATWNIYRTLYHPIFLTPGTTHTILITVLTGNFSLDFVDVYIADAAPVNPGYLITQGDSKAAGGQGTGGAAVTATTRFGGRVAAAFGLIESNFAIAGESLSFVSSATSPDESLGALGPGGGMYSGWQRVDAYTYTVASGTYAGTYTPWEGSSPAIALAAWGLNDLDFGPHGTTADPNIALSLTPLYYPERFKQRLRELIWRMMVNCPHTLCVITNIPPTIDVTAPDSEKQTWNAMIAAVCAEPTMQGYPLYVDCWNGLGNAIIGPPRTVYSGTPGTPAWFYDAIHPNAQGHAVIAEAIIQAIRGRKRAPGHLLGVW